uniref:acyl carrier protein n=1 Tax=Aeromonas sp. EERV15 TaxID=1833892 RepID=UPI0011477DEC
PPRAAATASARDVERGEPSAEAIEALESELSEGLAEALLTDPAHIDRDMPFSEMGYYSVLGVEWMEAINARYGLSLSPTKTYEYPTIKALARFIAQEQCRNEVAPRANKDDGGDQRSAEREPPRAAATASASDVERGEPSAEAIEALESELSEGLAEALLTDPAHID